MDSPSSRTRFGATVVALALFAASPALAERRGNFKGPVEATVLNVLDGDTFAAEAHVWPGQAVRINIRIRGIDAPEMKSRCEAERDAALQARDALAELVGGGAILISNIGGAKYYGRVLADVETPDGDLVADTLLERALVRPYRGGRRAGWCG